MAVVAVVALVLLVLALLALRLALDVHLDLLAAAAEHSLQIARVPLQQSAGLGAVGAEGHPQNAVGALADLHGDAAQMLRGELDAHQGFALLQGLGQLGVDLPGHVRLLGLLGVICLAHLHRGGLHVAEELPGGLLGVQKLHLGIVLPLLGLDFLRHLLDFLAELLRRHLFQQLGGAVLHGGVGGLQHGVRLGVGHIVQSGINHLLAVHPGRLVGPHQDRDVLAVRAGTYPDAHDGFALFQVLGQPLRGVLGQLLGADRGQVHLHPLGRLHRVLLLLAGGLFRLPGGRLFGLGLLNLAVRLAGRGLLDELLEVVIFGAGGILADIRYQARRVVGRYAGSQHVQLLVT